MGLLFLTRMLWRAGTSSVPSRPFVSKSLKLLLKLRSRPEVKEVSFLLAEAPPTNFLFMVMKSFALFLLVLETKLLFIFSALFYAYVVVSRDCRLALGLESAGVLASDFCSRSYSGITLLYFFMGRFFNSLDMLEMLLFKSDCLLKAGLAFSIWILGTTD